jgi:hypothetical protein
VLVGLSLWAVLAGSQQNYESDEDDEPASP